MSCHVRIRLSIKSVSASMHVFKTTTVKRKNDFAILTVIKESLQMKKYIGKSCQLLFVL